MARARYQEYSLRPPLDALVDCVWFLSGRLDGEGAGTVDRIPPDGTVEVIFHLGPVFRQVNRDRLDRQPQCLIVGVWTRPIMLVAPTDYDSLGIRFLPGAASAFLSAPLDTFTDTVVDAAHVWGRAATTLRDRLGETCSLTQRLALVQDFLRTRMRRPARALNRSLSRIASARGRVSIDALAREAGVSHRQLERAFRAHVGVPPKLLSRIVRFQHVLRIAPGGTGRWADIAIDCGYSDQAHLIRDFVQFAGETPASLMRSEWTVADYFRRR